MSDDRVQNREAPRNNTSATSNPRILPPNQLSRTPFSKLLDQQKLRMDQATMQSPSSSGAAEPYRPMERPAPMPVRERDPQAQQEFANRFRDRERDSDREDQKSRGSQDSGVRQVKIAEKKVVGRGPLSERQQNNSRGKGEGQSGSTGSGKQGKELGKLLTAKDVARARSKEAMRINFASKLAQALKANGATLVAQQAKAAKLPQVISKEMIDQIVRYVHLVTRADGEKELDLSLHEKIFRGLRLRVAVVQGKVEATFVTDSTEVKDLFTAHKGALREALGEKGIDVKQIDVIMA